MYKKHIKDKKWRFFQPGGVNYSMSGIDNFQNYTLDQLKEQEKLLQEKIALRTKSQINPVQGQIDPNDINAQAAANGQAIINQTEQRKAETADIGGAINNLTEGVGSIIGQQKKDNEEEEEASTTEDNKDGEDTKSKGPFSAQDYIAGAGTALQGLQTANLDGKITSGELSDTTLKTASSMAGPYGQVAEGIIGVGENLLGDNLYQGLGEGVEYEKTGSKVGKGALRGAALGTKVGGPLGCVCKGSRILINSGEFKNVEDLRIEDGVIGFDGKNYILQEIIGFHPPAKKECVEFETTLGQTLRCSVDHPIYIRKAGRAPRVVLNGKRTRVKKYNYVEAQYLEVGDSVGILNSFDVWGNEKMDKAYIVGMCIGDGSYGKSKGVRLYSADEDTWEYLETNKLGVPEKSRFLLETSKELRTYRIIDGCPLFRELGIYTQTKANKRLPINIQNYDKESVCNMLAGLFDSDGYVSFTPEKPNDGRIGFCQSNINLITQVKEQLIKLGVHCYLTTEKAHKQEINGQLCNIKEAYCLIIKDKSSVINFYNNILLNIKYKQKNLEAFYNYKLTCKVKDNKNVNNICAARITKITNIGEQDIYNLEAGGSHTYIANTIITHNSVIGAVAGGAMGFIGQGKAKRDAMKEFEKRRDERIMNYNKQSRGIYADQLQNFYKKGGKAVIKIKEKNKGKSK